MRQVVVLEPAGSVLVIRQTSLSSGGGVTGTNNSNLSGNNNLHDGHTLSVSSNGSNDHNQNRIVVVRSSSTCMTTTVSHCYDKN
ncbi:hypothetical protein M0802_016881 [Mischocyttarus mexicanus]|nr:hypothetical protein M0802_016881 [Mischocyttarus mexicanus]